MSQEIKMPKLSDTMEEGTVLAWRIKEGQTVKKGDIIAEVETDKAAMEMEAFGEGVVSAIKVKEGETVPVGTVLAVFESEAEESVKDAKKEEIAPDKTKEEPTTNSTESMEEKKEPAPERTKEEKQPEPAEDQGKSFAARVWATAKVSPEARALAEQKNIDLSRVRGSGPGGRIVRVDVEDYLARGDTGRRPSAPVGREPQKKSASLRKTIARKMTESWTGVPHFYVTVAVDMRDVMRFHRQLELSVNDFILAATARALAEHPEVNARWMDEGVKTLDAINLALAVAVDKGLYSPVIRDCARLSLRQIGERARELARKAQEGRLGAEDLSEGTFTVSNLGMFGVEAFAAIITAPQAAALAVGAVTEEVLADAHGNIEVVPRLRLTLSADHRVLDGADAAAFLNTLKGYLEAPVRLLEPVE